MNTNDAIKILKDNGLKYTDKRKDMLDIFVEEDKYLNANIQQKWIKIIQVYLLILYTVIFIF